MSEAAKGEATAPATDDIAALAKGGRTNILGFVIRLAGRLPFIFIAGHLYGAEVVGRFALAVLVIEFTALVATLGLKRGLAQAMAASGERPHAHVIADALMLALIASLAAAAVLIALPEIVYPNSDVKGLERFLPVIIFMLAWSDVAFSAAAYRMNVQAAVTARAIVEPWTISLSAWGLAYVTTRDGLIISYVLSSSAMLIAALIPVARMYGLPHGWRPHLAELFALARHNAPLAGADAIEWATRNVDRFIVGLLFSPTIVGIYYMAQQVASPAQRLKTTFDPILGPVITQALAVGDRAAVARQVRQVAFWVMAVQAALAIAVGVTSDTLMELLGKGFVAGAGALIILLAAEVLAATGAVSEGGLVYVARHRNLMVSVVMLGVQIGLSFVFAFAIRDLGYPIAYQAVGPALALAVSLAIISVVKAWMLRRILGAPVSGLRWGFVAALGAAGLAAWAINLIPEWAQLIAGIPLILCLYFAILLRFAFGPEDRALFQKMPREQTPRMGGHDAS